ncbi:AraC family transcriptional regulator [Microcoleus sp. FACHB-1515]|uniref:AraC family transcriptional regulator n=1 Tax=Cyanophyceae TaxID=3028117 RepID=UPI001686D4B0|nr:helix-turn-helix domain-containing protein [Microcoleus sp. FACHB-1515]MBD2093512.1 AraC family transcriptional regulator [Microcoleus sp. FACHB-1515]
MVYQTYQPQSHLSQVVEFLWIREGDNLPQCQSRLLPIGSIELVINLHEDRIPLFDRHSRAECGSTNGTMVCGVHSESFIIRNERKVSFIGVHFKPGGSSAFFALPTRELQNQIISLDELWKHDATELRERLLEAPTLLSRFLVLEQFLLTRMQPPKQHPAVEFALRQFSRTPEGRTVLQAGICSASVTSLIPAVKAVVEQTGFSDRHFNQLFRDQVGLTPKLFCRVQRLQQVLSLLSGKTQIDWLEIAFTCGYFDQAHLIHDFRSFADCTPTEYLAQRSFHPCHVVLPD